MKVLLSGHKGFIGTQIFDWLKTSGYEFTGFDKDENIPSDRFDIILNFGARTLIRKSREFPYEYFMDNLDLTLKLLEKARKEDSIIVYPTSGSVMEPTNPYSLSKRQGEEWVRLYNKMYGVRFYILKLYNIYGETSTKGAVYLFSNAAIKGEPVIIFGDGTHRRDYTHVLDLVKFVSLILSNEVEPGVYEVGTGVGTSVLELISMIEKECGTKLLKERRDFIVQEADDLHSRSPIMPNMIQLSEGIKRVLEMLRRS
jgi:nucleoside-diphosphate-sugar epimerase